MAPQNVSTQPTAAPTMQMSVQPSIEDAQSQKPGLKGKFEAMRLRGGGAGKDCFLGAIGCFLCCEVAATASPTLSAARAKCVAKYYVLPQGCVEIL
ncbi:hypothetical protein FRC07_004631 [Ceratobasidium sp. 392]|nr:hypothetical protein FRC07_004631 [Ceratobasidium sp. 392]